MLELTIPATELWDERTETFVEVKEHTIRLEHSLVSLSKWESKWHKPFLSKEDKTVEESIDYIRCMTLTQNVDPIVYACLTADNINTVNAYIEDPMTATTIHERNSHRNNEIVTAEIIYYWMISFGIPMECQKWHLNKLLTLIRVCNIKNQPDKKMSAREVSASYRALNEARRKKYHTKG